jgi:hypothetical protein
VFLYLYLTRRLLKGHREKKREKKVTQVSKQFFLAAAGKFAVFFIACLNSPCYETPKNARKKNRAKQPREGEKKNGGEKKPHFL